MQIHELNTKALTDPAYVAFDDGTDTYKADFKEVIDDTVAEAFSSADVSGGVVNYTSGDSSSPSSWSSVSVMSSGSTLATLMNRISTMVKNVRYLWSLIGSTSISNVSSTITGAIGNTSITGIGDGTLTGAISGINSSLTAAQTGVIARHSSTGTGGTIDSNDCYKVGKTVCASARLYNISLPATGDFFVIPEGFRPKYQTRCMGYLILSTNENLPTRITIGSNGVVSLAYSSNLTVIQVGFACSYPIE